MADDMIVTVTAETKSAEKQMDNFANSSVSILKKVGAAAAVYLSFKEVALFLTESVSAAVEAEKALRTFNMALASSGNFSDKASESFQEYAAQLQKVTGISDDLIIQNAAMLASIGNLSGGELERASKAALDYATFFQVDVATGFDVVTKATQGNVGALKKYGLEVSQTATDSQKFAAALQFINAQMGGAAESAANTYEGSVNRLSNSFSDLQENVGKTITKSASVRGLFVTIADSLDQIAEKVANADIENFLNNAMQFTLAFSYVVASLMERISSMVLAVGHGIIFIFKGVEGAFDHVLGYISQGIGTLLNNLFPGNLVAQAFSTFGADLMANAAILQSQATGAFNAAGSEIKNVFKGITEETGAASKAIIDFQARFSDATVKAQASAKTLNNGLKEPLKSVKDNANAVGGALSSAIGNAVSTMGKNLAAGKGMFSDFGKTMLKLFGELAQQIGAVFLSTGIGMLALGSMNPFVAIAAGIGLIALGSVLSALGSGGGSGAIGAGGGGPMSATADTSRDQDYLTDAYSEQEREKAKTGVTINVQGNILDRRETGLELAEILNSAFDTNGTLIRANA